MNSVFKKNNLIFNHGPTVNAGPDPKHGALQECVYVCVFSNMPAWSFGTRQILQMFPMKLLEACVC